MTYPEQTRLVEDVAAWLKKHGRYRPIPRGDGLYMERFYILSTKLIGIYLHRFWANDDDGLHDHPWKSASILLAGGYHEEEPERQNVPTGPTVTHYRRPLHPPIKLRGKYYAHRITLEPGTEGQCWSLFIRFGLKRRTWGFYRYGGWKAAPVQCRKQKQ